jgi:hypothetical protein
MARQPTNTPARSQYNYTFANGSAQQLTCGTPNTSISASQFALPPPVCAPPLALSASGTECMIPCPLPVFDEGTQRRIQWAFIAPALLGVVLCASRTSPGG